MKDLGDGWDTKQKNKGEGVATKEVEGRTGKMFPIYSFYLLLYINRFLFILVFFNLNYYIHALFKCDLHAVSPCQQCFLHIRMVNGQSVY